MKLIAFQLAWKMKQPIYFLLYHFSRIVNMWADLCTLHNTKSALASPQKTHFINELALCLALDILPNMNLYNLK